MKKLLAICTLTALSIGVLSPLSHATGGELTRVYGDGRIETSIAISKASFPEAKTAIIASEKGYADALSGGPLSIQVKGPILLSSTSIKDTVMRELKRLKVQDVIILGGTKAVSQGVEDTLKKSFAVKRLYGDNRYDTGEEISKYQNTLDKTTRTRLGYATGRNYADALVAGPFINKDGSLLLHDPALLLENPPFVFGGEAALPKVKNPTKRFEGLNRYETAVDIAKAYRTSGPYAPGQTVILASGQNYPDALAAAPLVNAYRSVLLLTNKDYLAPETKKYLESSSVKNIFILGGANAVSDKVKEEIIKLKEIKTV
ncbi:MAG: cell wall-binding repeat-containing protein, partial [Gallicola sp.]|nr:cell wall-binding repeat-containing protein [Gallicola sp.]